MIKIAVHINNIDIHSYRGIKELNIPNLGDINIIVGDNNTGKTSVLEAVQLLCEPNRNKLIQIARQRERYRMRIGIDFVESMRYLFPICSNNNDFTLSIGGEILGKKGIVTIIGYIYSQLIDFNELLKDNLIRINGYNGMPNIREEKIEELDTFHGEIVCDFEDKKYHPLSFEIIKTFPIKMESESINCILPSEIVLTVDHIINNAVKDTIKNKIIKNKVVELLREEFDENITDLRIIPDDKRFIPVVDIENGDYIPLSLYGDGMRKALTMVNAIVKVQNGVVLIDEFESALHTSAMKRVFSFVIDAAKKNNVQLFMTTHSLEAVDKLLEAAEDCLENVRVVRLRKKNGKTFSNVMDGKEAVEIRQEYDMELRV